MNPPRSNSKTPGTAHSSGRRVVLPALICLLASAHALAQSPPSSTYQRQQIFASYADFKSQLQSIVAISDPVQRDSQLNAFWTTLENAGQVPYAQGNQYAFLYRGTATSVAFAGDLNNWNPSVSSAQATNYPGTNLWIREGTLPADARTDYKIVVNGNYILDPDNPLQMWSGVGTYNNELRMPSYVFPQETVSNPSVAKGTLTGDTLYSSTSMGYGINYRVYTPAGYAANLLQKLPVVYVADGHEYLANYMGAMPNVLDNLIASGQLRPTIAVFIDPRQPGNPSVNRRLSEYNMNANFANFVAGELVPAIDAAYRTDATAEGRTILGTSVGGLNAAYFGAVKGNVFQNIAPQSPAYNYNSSIYSLYQNNNLQFLDIYQTNGTLGVDGSAANSMANIWTARGYDFDRLIANEGHSWGQWRGQLDSILTALIGPPLVGDYNQDGIVDGGDYVTWRKKSGAAGIANRDPANTGPVGAADYASWRSHFGETLASIAPGSGLPSAFLLPPSAFTLPVPEPAFSGMFFTGMFVTYLSHRHQRTNAQRTSLP